MQRLSDATLARVRPAVRVPRYDRAGLRPGLVHLGVGAFHRSHQAEFTEDLIEAGREDRFITGINLLPPLLRPSLGAQDGLYSRAIQETGGVDVRVIGCLRRVIDAAADPGAALEAIVDPAVDIVTMTITEKGYCHVPATGELDPAHAGLRADLAATGPPATAPGFLVAALAGRRARHGKGINLVSCDNIPSNGAVLRAVTVGFAALHDPSLAEWISNEVRFPATMVDRIVPATSEADRAAAAAMLGLADDAAVVAERYREWVLEADFVGDRPCWEACGAVFVADVTPRERIKMRVLNAAQTVVALIGTLLGLEHAHQGIAHPALRRFLLRFFAETASAVPRPAGFDLGAYQQTTLGRIGNTAIRHRTSQIATDSSQKIVQRLLDPIRDNLRQQRPVVCLVATVAAFVAVRARATRPFGAAWVIDDPISGAAEAAAIACAGHAEAFVDAVAGWTGIFGDLSAERRFADPLRQHFTGWMQRPDRYLDRLGQEIIG